MDPVAPPSGGDRSLESSRDKREELHVERTAPGDVASPTQPSAGLRERAAALARRVRPTATALRSEPFGDETLEITLMEEQVVVTKRVVPRERVRLRTETVTASEPIEAILRKEEVALERPPVPSDVGDVDA